MTSRDPDREFPRVHILNQYVWPDAAPTGVYAEQLADRLNEGDCTTVLVGGNGSYRTTSRPKPVSKIVKLEAYRGRRGSHLSTLQEYASVHRKFRDYIEANVHQGDLVIVTSAPPSTITLHNVVKSRGATAVYWLQDYYPELLLGVWRYPQPVRDLLGKYWDKHLSRWDHVVKAATNLAYFGPNSRVLRNWPTLNFDASPEPEKRTALYSGNLGFGHDIGRFIDTCRHLHERGYVITVRGDGPGIRKLPGWISVAPPFESADELRDAFLGSEVHLVAAHPDIRGAIFPSKIWNSLAANREVVCSGFEHEMLDELHESRKSLFHDHLDHWVGFVRESLARPPVSHRTNGFFNPERQLSAA
jgi:hypothetical protein